MTTEASGDVNGNPNGDPSGDLNGNPSGDPSGGSNRDPNGDPTPASRFTEEFGAQLAWAGMPRMPARVFAALLASDEGALTAADLGERLHVSPAAVSGAVRYLTQQYMITRERERGSRRDIFRVRGNQWYEALGNRDAVLQRWEGALREGIVQLGPDTPAGQRLKETLAFFEFVQEELAGLLERWRVRREELFGTEAQARRATADGG
ncbi:GbsR/MarR family transcriptional regulator [Streptomyces sp. G45]|uniref:GbsR/MarR family transcriptional regulator n=1 Tax=Streptomyces sp. G45 TaxID=3406627 RepID=UPI003C134D26